MFPKPPKFPQCSKYSLFRMKHIAHSIQDPQGHQTWAATQPFQKSLTRSSSPLCWSLKKNCKTCRPFLDTLNVAEVQASRFLWANNLNQVLSLANYNTQIQIDYTNSHHVLFNQHHIYSSNPRPFAPQKSSCQSPCKTMIHTAHEKFSLSNRNCAPSLKPTHQDPFAITCKTSKQTKNKNKSENKFFDAFESSHRQ